MLGGYFLFGFCVDPVEDFASGALAKFGVNDELVVADYLRLHVRGLHFGDVL